MLIANAESHFRLVPPRSSTSPPAEMFFYRGVTTLRHERAGSAGEKPRAHRKPV